MGEAHSRRSFLAGALISGALGAVANRIFVDRAPARKPLPNAVAPVIGLKLATGTDNTGTRDQLLRIWKELHPEIQVQIVRVAGSTKDQLATFEDSGADVLNLDLIHIPHFADGGTGLRTLTQAKNMRYLPSIEKACTVKGSKELWALPFNADAGMLFRRVPVRPDPDLATDLATVMARAEAGRPRFAGQLEWSEADEEAFVVNVLEQAYARDRGLLTDDGETWDFDHTRWNKALTPLRTALQEKSVVATLNEDSSDKAFKTGNLPYMRNWPFRLGALDRGERGGGTERIEVRPIPYGILGGQFLAITARCPHPVEAERLIRFLTGIPAQRILALAGFAPSCTAVYNDTQVTNLVPQLKAVRIAVDNAIPRPVHRNYTDFASLFAADTKAFLTDGTDLTPDFTTRMVKALR
ncbi:extracellular solute-binding protein [Actinoplanes sp. NPDC051494]|uniref:extracellular solute-binding protein n=1 Tax=Actinoplanes sp. NPDC051494 TaxID=3363907 RepID=UPI00378FC83F